MANFSINDTENMAIALRLAKQGCFGVKGNPMVGCVITKDKEIIAKGYHHKFGEAHAEIDALDKISHQAKNTTMYVNLEPCSHTGKTPPCAKAIIDSGVSRVVISSLDPNPKVSGKGVKMLEKSGVKVDIGLLENEAKTLNQGFFKRMSTSMPFVTCKIAMSLDGKTSMSSGESKWISSEASRLDVQRLRAQNQAIITGSGTVLTDDPFMTVRLEHLDSKPLRVVVDGNNQIQNKNFNIFSDDAPTLIFNQDNAKTVASGKLDLENILHELANKEMNNVLLEAGPGLVGAMIENRLIDQFIIYIAPMLMGSNANSLAKLALDTMAEKVNLEIQDIRMLGPDIKLSAGVKT